MLQALSDTTGWVRWFADPKDAYLWRARITGAKLRDPSDALELLRAVAKAQELSLDAKAIAVTGAAGEALAVDVILTADSFTPYAVPDTAKVVAARVARDPDIRARFPNIEITSPKFLTLVAPADAIDFWRAHVTLYDDKVGPTAAFAQQQGVYVGAADDGPRAKSWTAEPPPKLNGGDDKPSQLEPTITFFAWAAAAAAAAWLGAHLIFPEETTR